MHPEFIKIGPLTLYSYGVLVALGFLIGAWVAASRAKIEGLKPELVGDLLLWMLPAILLGAKIWYALAYWNDFLADFRAFGVGSLRSGFVFYGGFIGGFAATAIFARKKSLNLWQLADILAPGLAIGHAFGRVGCFFNGCCYGKECALPWAVQFPRYHETAGAPVHPTQLYEAGANLLIFAALLLLYRRKKFHGQIFAAYATLYAVARFVIEFFRGDYPARYFGALTQGHIGSILLFAFGVFLWKRQKNSS
jgi:phosphatidylglycerol:prolipoprotein diacylglycerol transferase